MIDNQKMSIILPGRIVEYFSETQTATIQISAETIYSNADSISETKIRDPLEDVPVHTPSGGGWSLTMPIKKGDTCLLLFSQVGYDHWLYKDKDKAGKLAALPKPWLKRQFSVDDGFALVGLNTIPRAVKSYTTDGSQWRSDTATQNIHLKSDLSIEINSPISVTINAPTVVVNCETSEVNATSSATITTATATVDANLVEIDSPITNISGALNVTGKITGSSGLAISGGTGASITGNLQTTGDVTAGTVSLINHIHSGVGGNTSPPL